MARKYTMRYLTYSEEPFPDYHFFSKAKISVLIKFYINEKERRLKRDYRTTEKKID